MSPKGEKLEKFFRDLARDQGLYQQYLANPEAVMRSEGLDDDVIQAVLQGNLTFINDLVKDSNLICGTLVRI
jgi:hypothetical protein